MHDTIIQFWFEEIEPKRWFKQDKAFDDEIRQRFCELHKAAAQCELFHWRIEPAGRLAEILILDQFSRNLYRDQAQAFAFDALALGLAQEAVARGDDRKLPSEKRRFLYMPYMHSESQVVHEQALELFRNLDGEESLEYELRHKKIIDRFGRYPHRNKILGRVSSTEELEFLQQPGSSF